MSPAVGFQDATAIAGIAQTEFAKHLEPTETELACTVIVDACADAGIDPSEIDALCSYTMEATEEVDIVRNIGCGEITFFSQIGYGGGAGCGVVGHAAMAVASGQAEVAVAWRSRKRGSGPRPWTSTSVQLRVPVPWTRPFGMLRPVDEIAMLTRRYMHEYGATPRAPRQRGHGRAQARQHEPSGHHVQQAHDPRGLHGIAMGVRAALPLRQLPRDRRCAGVRRRVCRAGPRPAPPARLRPRLRPGPAAPAPDDGQFLQRRPAHRTGVGVRPAAVGERRLRTGRRERGADLRRLLAAHPAVARGLRVLQAR